MAGFVDFPCFNGAAGPGFPGPGGALGRFGQSSHRTIQTDFSNGTRLRPTPHVEVVAAPGVCTRMLNDLSHLLEKNTGPAGNTGNAKNAGNGKLPKIGARILVTDNETAALRLFQKTQPEPDEVLVFLCDNAQGLSGQGSGHLKIGERIQQALKAFPASTKSDQSRLDRAFEVLDRLNPFNYTAEDLVDLIREGIVQNLPIDRIIQFIENLPLFRLFRFEAKVARGIADFFAETTDFGREIFRIKEHRWNPDVEPSKEAPDGFDAYFLPKGLEGDVEFLVDSFADKADELIDEGIRGLQERISDWKTGFKAIFDDHLEKIELPEWLKLEEVSEPLEEVILNKFQEMLKEFVRDVAGFLGELYLTHMRVQNAFMCGIWNSLVEIVYGIVDLIGLVFRVLEFAYDMLGNPLSKVPRLIFLMLRTGYVLSQTSFLRLFVVAVVTIARNFQDFPFHALQAVLHISPEKIAYFLGFVVGMVVELIVEALLTGGTAAVKKLAESAVKTMTKLLKTFPGKGKKLEDLRKAEIQKKSRGSGSESVLDNFMDSTEEVLEFLESGEEGVEKFLDDLFDSLRALGKMDPETLAKIKRRLKDEGLMDDDEFRAMERSDMEIVSFSDDAGEIAGEICPI